MFVFCLNIEKFNANFFIKIFDKRFNLGITCKFKHNKNTTMKHCIHNFSICLNQEDLIVIILLSVYS